MIVSFENLRPDMVLAADVLDAGGRMLLPAGITLTEKHLRYCQMWGISEVSILGDDPTAFEVNAPTEEELAAAAAEVRGRFRYADTKHPFVAALFDHCVQIRARAGGFTEGAA